MTMSTLKHFFRAKSGIILVECGFLAAFGVAVLLASVIMMRA